METNIDDCSGEMLGFVMEQLLDKGALDVFFTSIFMKKNSIKIKICRIFFQNTANCNLGNKKTTQLTWFSPPHSPAGRFAPKHSAPHYYLSRP